MRGWSRAAALAAALLLASTAAVGHGASVRVTARAPQVAGSAANAERDVLAAAAEDDLFDAVDDVADVESGSAASPAAPGDEETAPEETEEPQESESSEGDYQKTLDKTTDVVDKLVDEHGSAGPNWDGPSGNGAGSSAPEDAGNGSGSGDDARKEVFPPRGERNSSHASAPRANDVMFGGSGSEKEGESVTSPGNIEALARATGSTGTVGGGDDSADRGDDVFAQLAQRMQSGAMSSAALRRAARRAAAIGSAAVQPSHTAPGDASSEKSAGFGGFSFRSLRSGTSLRSAARAAARTQAQARAEAQIRDRIMATAEDMVVRQAEQAQAASAALPPTCPKDSKGQVCSGHGSCVLDDGAEDEEGGVKGKLGGAAGKAKAGLAALARFRETEGKSEFIGGLVSSIASGISGAVSAISNAAKGLVGMSNPVKPPEPPKGKCTCENGFFGGDCSVDVNGGCSPLDPTCGKPQAPKPMPCIGRPDDFPLDSPCNEPDREYVPYPPQEPPAPAPVDEKPNA